jgi:hypothetical protein
VLYRVSARNRPAHEVEAANWLLALGHALDASGDVPALDRLAIEVLPNGQVLARDARTGQGWVVEAAQPGGVTPGPDADAPFEVGDDGDPPPEPDTEEIDLLGQRALRDTVRGARSPSLAWESALDTLSLLVSAEATAALRVEPGGALRFVAATGARAATLRGALLPAGAGLAGFCIARNVALHVTNPRQDPRFYGEVDKATGFITHELLCVPVPGPTGPRGCIELLNPPAPFTNTHLERARDVAALLGERLSSWDGGQSPP